MLFIHPPYHRCNAIELAEKWSNMRREKHNKKRQEELEIKSFDRVWEFIKVPENFENVEYYHLKFAQKLFKWLFIARDKIYKKRIMEQELLKKENTCDINDDDII
jgi:hypothetical protein